MVKKENSNSRNRNNKENKKNTGNRKSTGNYRGKRYIKNKPKNDKGNN